MKWIVALALLSLGCGSKDAGDDAPKDDTDTDVDPKTESNCTDGTDNDEDGDVDCADEDCAEAFECNWPDAMGHTTDMDFDGRTIECKFFGTTIDYDVDDCNTNFTADLTYDPADESCAACDRVYTGPLTWVRDSCSELLGESGPKPESTQYGFDFVSETARTLYVNDPTAGWTEAAALVLEGSEWVSLTEAPVEEDIDECGNGVQYLGDLTVRVSFTDQ